MQLQYIRWKENIYKSLEGENFFSLFSFYHVLYLCILCILDLHQLSMFCIFYVHQFTLPQKKIFLFWFASIKIDRLLKKFYFSEMIRFWCLWYFFFKIIFYGVENVVIHQERQGGGAKLILFNRYRGAKEV